MKMALLPITACVLLLLPGCIKTVDDGSMTDVARSKQNLKQIGLAFIMWADGHNDHFPFNVSQALGGTRELCHRDNDGFEENPVPVFMVMTNELPNTRILVCPNDKTKKAAADFASLTTNNISYKLRTGTNVSPDHLKEILAVDSINGLALHCDGSVVTYDLHKTQ
jgi:hypothetical protein